jgi:hypothetical protein
MTYAEADERSRPIFRYGLMLANDGELDGKHYLSHAAMDELRKEGSIPKKGSRWPPEGLSYSRR